MKKVIREILLPVIITALLSGMLSFVVGRYLLNKEISYDVRKARIDIIKDTEELFAQSEIAALLLGVTINEHNLSNNISNICITSILEGKTVNPQLCDINHYQKSQLSNIKDSYLLRAKYNSLLRLTKIYFCDESKVKFDSLNKNNDWWSIGNSSLRNEILELMYKELECRIY